MASQEVHDKYKSARDPPFDKSAHPGRTKNAPDCFAQLDLETTLVYKAETTGTQVDMTSNTDTI